MRGQAKLAIRDIYDFNDLLLAATGFARNNFPKKYQRIIYLIYRMFVIFLFYSHVILILVKVYLDTQGVSKNGTNLQILSFTLSFAMTATAGLYKFSLLESNRDILYSIDRRLRCDFNAVWIGDQKWVEEVRQKSSERMQRLAKVLYGLIFFGLTLTMITPFQKDSNLKFCLPFPFPEMSESPYYIPIYLANCFTMTTFILFFTTTDIVFFGLVTRCCDNLTFIELSLKRFQFPSTRYSDFIRDYSEFETEDADGENTRVELSRREAEKEGLVLIRNCIAHHLATSKVIYSIDDVYRKSLFIYLVCGPVLVGFMTYVILSDLSSSEIAFQQASYAVPAVLFILLYCFYGTMLLDKGKDVHMACYSFPWYEMTVKTQKLIVTALIFFGRTRKVTAGKVVDVALTTFLSLVKFTYNWVTLLRSTS